MEPKKICMAVLLLLIYSPKTFTMENGKKSFGFSPLAATKEYKDKLYKKQAGILESHLFNQQPLTGEFKFPDEGTLKKFFKNILNDKKVDKLAKTLPGPLLLEKKHGNLNMLWLGRKKTQGDKIEFIYLAVQKDPKILAPLILTRRSNSHTWHTQKLENLFSSALTMKETPLLTYLLKKGFDPNQLQPYQIGHTLNQTLKQKPIDREALKSLLPYKKEYPTDIIIDTVAANKENNDVIQELVGHGFFINKKNEQERTLLHTAAKNNNVPLVDWLLKKGANVNAQDKEGTTPLHTGIAFPAVVKALCYHGADLTLQDTYQANPVHTAQLSNDENTTILLAYAFDKDVLPHVLSQKNAHNATVAQINSNSTLVPFIQQCENYEFEAFKNLHQLLMDHGQEEIHAHLPEKTNISHLLRNRELRGNRNLFTRKKL